MAVNVPQTIWQSTQGNTEFSNTGVNNIVDSSAVFLIDPSGVFIVDTGVTATPIPATIWSENDGQ